MFPHLLTILLGNLPSCLFSVEWLKHLSSCLHSDYIADYCICSKNIFSLVIHLISWYSIYQESFQNDTYGLKEFRFLFYYWKNKKPNKNQKNPNQ